MKAFVRTLLLIISAIVPGCSPGETTPTAEPLAHIDFSYPNNWRAPELTDADFRMTRELCPEPSETVRHIDPLLVIIDLARKHHIVMINESHSKSLHRVFIGEVAMALRAEGFDHFGAELFGSTSADWLNSDVGLRGSASYLADHTTNLTGTTQYWGKLRKVWPTRTLNSSPMKEIT